MQKQTDFINGTRFGFGLILIWLTLLTGWLMYDKMNVGEKINKVMILPPPVEVLEDIGGDTWD